MHSRSGEYTFDVDTNPLGHSTERGKDNKSCDDAGDKVHWAYQQGVTGDT